MSVLFGPTNGHSQTLGSRCLCLPSSLAIANPVSSTDNWPDGIRPSTTCPYAFRSFTLRSLPALGFVFVVAVAWSMFTKLTKVGIDTSHWSPCLNQRIKADSCGRQLSSRNSATSSAATAKTDHMAARFRNALRPKDEHYSRLVSC